MKLSHIALATSALLALNGCLKVKDNNNSELVANAIDKQTAAQQQLAAEQQKLLAEQQKLAAEQLRLAAEQQKQTAEQQKQAAEQQKKQQLTVSGLVRGYRDSVDLSNAQVRLLIGNTFTDPVKVVDGAYTLPNVPKNSNVVLIVENKEKNVNFVTELYAFKTTSGDTENTVQQLPQIIVAKPVSHKFQVLNIKDNKSIELNQVYATTLATDSAFKLDAYLLKASYDKTLAEYSIVLPENFTGSIVTDLDLDKDNSVDYVHVQDSTLNFNTLFTANTLKNGYVYLEAAAATYQELTIQLKLIDSNTGQLLSVPYVLIDNSRQALTRAVSQPETNNYQAKTRYYTYYNIDITVPQFDTADKRYTTKTYRISRNNNGVFDVYGGANFSTALVNGILDLTLPVEGGLKSAAINMGTVLKTIDSKNDIARMFFNLPAGLDNNAFTLVTEGEVVVTPGSTAANAPAPGTTRVTAAPALTVPFSMVYNDTAAQMNLANFVKPGYTQRLYLNQFYAKGNVLNKLSGEKNTLSDEIILPVKNVTTEFKPTDIVIDNKNYSTAGALLNPKNTAGFNDWTAPNQSSYQLALLIPESALSLESLQVKLSYQGRTVLQNTYNPTPANYRMILALPSNERLENDSSALLDQYSMQGLTTTGRYIYSSFYTSPTWIKDDTATETVKMQLEYSYLTKAGVTQSGTVELPVR